MKNESSPQTKSGRSRLFIRLLVVGSITAFIIGVFVVGLIVGEVHATHSYTHVPVHTILTALWKEAF